MPLLPKPPMMRTHGYISSTFYSTQNSGNDARSDLFRVMALRNVSNTPTEKNCSLLLLNGYYWQIYIYIYNSWFSVCFTHTFVHISDYVIPIKSHKYYIHACTCIDTSTYNYMYTVHRVFAYMLHCFHLGAAKPQTAAGGSHALSGLTFCWGNGLGGDFERAVTRWGFPVFDSVDANM